MGPVPAQAAFTPPLARARESTAAARSVMMQGRTDDGARSCLHRHHRSGTPQLGLPVPARPVAGIQRSSARAAHDSHGTAAHALSVASARREPPPCVAWSDAVHDQIGFAGVYSIQLVQRYTPCGDPRPPSWGAPYDLPNENAPSQLSTWFPPP